MTSHQQWTCREQDTTRCSLEAYTSLVSPPVVHMSREHFLGWRRDGPKTADRPTGSVTFQMGENTELAPKYLSMFVVSSDEEHSTQNLRSMKHAGRPYRRADRGHLGAASGPDDPDWLGEKDQVAYRHQSADGSTYLLMFCIDAWPSRLFPVHPDCPKTVPRLACYGVF